MFDAAFGKVFAPLLDRIARRSGGRAGVLELVSFCIALTAAVLIAGHFVWTGIIIFAVSRIAAAVAARDGDSANGAVFAAVAYGALPFAFVLDAPVRALPSVFLMFGLIAHTAAAFKIGRGFTGGIELFLLFVLAAALPAWFGLIAYTGGVLCFVAAGMRLASGRVS